MNARPRPTLTLAFTEAYFHDLARALDEALLPGELYTAWLSAESSDFVRFNRGKVRQPGSVTQATFDVDLIAGRRHALHRITLSGDLARDREALRTAVAGLRDVLPALDDDPHLLVATDVQSSRNVAGAALPAAEAILDTVLAPGQAHDLVGFYAGGPVVRAFANALGQRNWHESTSFNLQWSLYHRADKAVTAGLSGFTWDEAAFTAKMREAESQLASMALPARSLAPGTYRCYLAPAAVEELAGMLHWGGFSARALATRQSSLVRMRQEADGACIDPRVTMVEATAAGVAPGFQSAGFVRPPEVPLIVDGRLVGALTSPRSAQEFGLTANGANSDERPESLAIKGGDLPIADALAALDTGLYVGNLWYLNYSDRPACRITGMTRFGTFWVEDGRIVAPVEVLRFDDTFFHMFGPSLEALTTETELRLDTSTYQQRSLASMRVPGALLSALTFTL